MKYPRLLIGLVLLVCTLFGKPLAALGGPRILVRSSWQTINIGDVIILRNITVFKELDFAKTNFIATVSHELKTPISSIKMSLQLLEKTETGVLNEDQKQLIESIKDDSQRLLKITGELLKLSQLETGNIKLNIGKSNPYEIVKYATEAIKTQAEQKQVELVITAQRSCLTSRQMPKKQPGS